MYLSHITHPDLSVCTAACAAMAKAPLMHPVMIGGERCVEGSLLSEVPTELFTGDLGRTVVCRVEPMPEQREPQSFCQLVSRLWRLQTKHANAAGKKDCSHPDQHATIRYVPTSLKPEYTEYSTPQERRFWFTEGYHSAWMFLKAGHFVVLPGQCRRSQQRADSPMHDDDVTQLLTRTGWMAGWCCTVRHMLCAGSWLGWACPLPKCCPEGCSRELAEYSTVMLDLHEKHGCPAQVEQLAGPPAAKSSDVDLRCKGAELEFSPTSIAA